MLSVYYHTVGRQFEIRGAPSVMLPPEVRPMSLEGALAVLAPSPTRLREALWRIVQSVPLDMSKDTTVGPYPTAIVKYLTQERRPPPNTKVGDKPEPETNPLQELDELRREYRAGANVFAAALVACRDNDFAMFGTMREFLMSGDKHKAKTGDKDTELEDIDNKLEDIDEGTRSSWNFSDAIEELLEVRAPQYLGGMLESFKGKEGKLRIQIGRIETEIGCSIQYFVESLADVAAFEKFMEPPAEVGATRVYPVCSIIRQDTKTLVTSATVTTIVSGTFKDLCRVIDPAHWADSSDVITKSKYISGPFTFSDPSNPIKFEEKQEKPIFLHEVAKVSWNGNLKQQAVFRNVLNIRTSVRPVKEAPAAEPAAPGGDAPVNEQEQADVDYNLCRSINSSVLWDRRPGGLLVNQGYIKLRPLGGSKWRVTMRKEIQFSDRTPYENPAGLRDVGQLASYLAPATLTWWLECQTYSFADKRKDQANAGLAAARLSAVRFACKQLKSLLESTDAQTTVTGSSNG